MTRSIAHAVAELKSSVCQALDPDEIQRACVEAGHTWRARGKGDGSISREMAGLAAK